MNFVFVYPSFLYAVITVVCFFTWVSEIKTVILSLDSENENHFTTKGKPKVEAVRSRMPDVEVSADDVAEAYKGLEVG